ncbi:hypothetical protein [Deinococcus petrolearius]|uniref:DUF3800 domain-containing protein n=1 Tax=Deinococcus petrolearius TaxID=1751295 RepID=A0ABW1DKZ0_9DEIO
MKRVYLDESGFTGTHLLDAEQPVYTVATVILDESEADDLKRRHFGTYQGPELKFSRLKRQPRHLRASNDLLEELLDRRAVKLSAADKRFVLIAKMFDLITEPLLHALGHDAYQDGFLADFASQVYLLLDGRDPVTLTRAMQAFVQLCENPSEAHRQGYIAAMRAFPDDLSELLETVLIQPAEVMNLDVLRVELPEGPLGIVLTCGLVPVINACREVPSRPLSVIYDRSKVMQHSLSLWNWYLSPHLPPRQIGV